MRIQNIGGKIIRLGKLTLLPGETDVVPQGFENNPVVKHFADMGLVAFVENAKPVKEDNANSQQSGGEKKPEGDNGDGGEKKPEDDKNSDDGQQSETDVKDEVKTDTKNGAQKPGRGGSRKPEK